jgi:hypothetical protein
MMKTFRQNGAAMMLFVLFFAFSAGAIIFSLNQSIYADFRDFNQLGSAKQAFYTSESLLEDMVYRQVFDSFSLNSSETFSLAGATAYATTTYDSTADEYITESKGVFGVVQRKTEAVVTITGGSSFNYGLQAGTGGITLANSADIYGNVYSNGSVVGSGSSEIFGDVVSAGASGLVKSVVATGTVYSNTIDRITAGGDAHYNVQIGTNAQNPVTGTRYTPATNQPIVDFPISTTTIQEWKDDIVTYGTVISASDPLCSSGTYTINTSVTIGFLKVECNLDIRKTGGGITVTIDGPIWVQGNLSFSQGPTMRVDSALGRRSVQFIVDNPSNRLTSSKISVNQSTEFYGSGDSRSYIMLLSMNDSAYNSGTEKAINVAQSANGSVLVYAGKGLVDIGNGIELTEVTGYKINVAQNADIIYESGLASLLFTAGPGGSYAVADWRQVK